MVTGKVSTKDNVPKILVDSFEDFNPKLVEAYQQEINKREGEEKQSLIISLENIVNPDALNRMKRVLSNYQGPHDVVLYFSEEEKKRKIKTPFKVKYDDSFKRDVRIALGYEPRFEMVEREGNNGQSL